MDLQRLFDGGVDVILDGVLTEERLHRKRAARDLEDRNVAEERRKLLSVHRG